MYDEFSKLHITDRSLYETYLNMTDGVIPSSLYFTELMAWDFYNTNYYRIIEGYLCILVDYRKNGKLLFLPPLGKYCRETFERVVIQLSKYAQRYLKPLIFLDASEQMKDRLLAVPDFQYEVYDRQAYRDYFYSYQDFVGMFQKSSVQYAYRYFLRRNKPVLHQIDDTNVRECMLITKRYYCDVHICEDCTYGCELEVMEEIMKDYEKLGLKGILVEQEGEMIGYCMAQVYHNDLVFHFKKSKRSVRGLNEYLHYHMLEQFSDKNDIQWVNYTDDMGIPGLRKYKSTLAPYQLKPRYLIQMTKGKDGKIQE